MALTPETPSARFRLPAFTVAMGAMPARAQAQDKPAASPNDDIIVTARRRNETLNNVPIAITAFGRPTGRQGRGRHHRAGR
jgi:outer membrane receptor protein involved in Fe transport